MLKNATKHHRNVTVSGGTSRSMVCMGNLHLTNGKRQTPYKKNQTSRWDRKFACKEIVVVTKKSLSCVTSLYTLDPDEKFHVNPSVNQSYPPRQKQQQEK
jgi:hypothetical protein